MTISKTRKQYTTEFKEEALRLASKIGTTKAARELSVYQSQIYSWRPARPKEGFHQQARIRFSDRECSAQA